MSDNLIIGIVFSLVGGLLAAIAVFIFMRTRIFMSNAQAVKGTVVQMVYHSGGDSGGGYSPVYQFTTIDGQVIVVTDNLSSNPPMFKGGK